MADFAALADTWPARLIRSMYEAAKLPGDVYAGRVTSTDPEYYERAADLAGLVMSGGTLGGVPSGGMVAGSGPVRRISGQRFRDERIVADKLANQDFDVLLSPPFRLGNRTYEVVLDGHHSLEAAKRAGGEPRYIVADATMNDTVALLPEHVDDFLKIHRNDGPYYDVSTGRNIFLRKADGRGSSK